MSESHRDQCQSKKGVCKLFLKEPDCILGSADYMIQVTTT